VILPSAKGLAHILDLWPRAEQMSQEYMNICLQNENKGKISEVQLDYYAGVSFHQQMGLSYHTSSLKTKIKITHLFFGGLSLF